MRRKNQKNPKPHDAPAQDKRLGRMVMFSGFLHVVLLLVLGSAADPLRPKSWTPQSYTVSLVAPAALGPVPEPPPAPSPKKRESEAVAPLPAPEPRPPVVKTKKPEREMPVRGKKVEKKPKATKPEKKKSVQIVSKKEPSKRVSPPEKKKKPSTKTGVKNPLARRKEKKPPPKSSPPKESEVQRLSAEDRERQIAAAMDKVRRRMQAAPSAGGGGGNTLRGLSFIVYTQEVKQRVRQSWIVAEPKPGLTAVVRFGILANGEVVGMELIERSGDTVFDESALRAVRKASPLPPPPAAYRNEFTQQKVEVVFGETRGVGSQQVRSE